MYIEQIESVRRDEKKGIIRHRKKAPTTDKTPDKEQKYLIRELRPNELDDMISQIKGRSTSQNLSKEVVEPSIRYSKTSYDRSTSKMISGSVNLTKTRGFTNYLDSMEQDSYQMNQQILQNSQHLQRIESK